MRLLNRVLVVCFAVFFIACSEDETQMPEEKVAIEIVNRIEVICHRGSINDDPTKSFTADRQPVGSPYLRKNVLVFERKAGNDWKIVSMNGNEGVKESDAVLPISSSGDEDYESINHAFEFIYYNKKGDRINATFSDDDKAYQTFFSIDELTNNATKAKATLTDGGKGVFDYVYRDTNPENGMFEPSSEDVTLTNSNLGLKGHFEFKKSKVSFGLNVTLVKFKEGYEKKSSPILTDVSQENIEEKITITIPVNVFTKIGYSDEAQEQYLKDIAKYFSISEEKAEEFEGYDAETEEIKYSM